jgi:PadR family transcriptional regulator PadR
MNLRECIQEDRREYGDLKLLAVPVRASFRNGMSLFHSKFLLDSNKPFLCLERLYYWIPIFGADMDIITRLEEAILIAVWRLRDDAYGVAINTNVSKFFDKKYTMGALYYSLDQLLRKGLVEKTLRRGPEEKAGRSRTYYRLTRRGERALQEARAYQKRLWNGIPEMVFDADKSR